MSENEPNGGRKAAGALKRVFGSLANDFRTGVRDLNSRIKKEVQATAPSVEILSQPQESRPAPNLRPALMSARRVSGSEGTGSGGGGGSPWRRILVVGGMDFLGAGIVRQLNRKGLRNIVVVDDVSDGRWRNLPALQMELFLKPGELAERHGRQVLGQEAFSQVFYLGGWGSSSPIPSANAILEIALQQGSRFISLSPSEALGLAPERDDLSEGRVENFRPETEEGVLANLFDRHAIEKLGGLYVAAKHHQLFGPGASSERGCNGLLLAAWKQIRADGSVRLPINLQPESDSGSRKYDFLSLRRAAQMALFLGGRRSAAGVFELGSGAGHTIMELVEALFIALGREPVIIWDDQAELTLGSGPANADLSRLTAEGWASESPPLEESVKVFLRSLSGEDDYWNEELNQNFEAQVQIGRTPKTFKKKPFAH